MFLELSQFNWLIFIIPHENFIEIGKVITPKRVNFSTGIFSRTAEKVKILFHRLKYI